MCKNYRLQCLHGLRVSFCRPKMYTIYVHILFTSRKIPEGLKKGSIISMVLFPSCTINESKIICTFNHNIYNRKISLREYHVSTLRISIDSADIIHIIIIVFLLRVGFQIVRRTFRITFGRFTMFRTNTMLIHIILYKYWNARPSKLFANNLTKCGRRSRMNKWPKYDVRGDTTIILRVLNVNIIA